jgi:hypothetical protein
MASNIPTFKLVLGKPIVASYLTTPVSHHSSLNFLIDNVSLVLDGLALHLLAFSPRTSPEILLDCVQLAMVELARPLLSR